MSDDLREREPDRTRGEDPTVEGTRSDHAGTGTGSQGPAPAAGAAHGLGGGLSGPSQHGGQGGGVVGPSAGGGYGSTSDSGGSGDSEGRTNAGEDPQTDWLRGAPGGKGESDPEGGTDPRDRA